jgi:predicted ATPase with chaperone activity
VAIPPSPAAVAVSPAARAAAAVRVGGASADGSASTSVDKPPPPANASLTGEEPSSRFPREPKTWEEAGLDPVFIEQLVLRFLLVYPSENARNIANELCLHAQLIKDMLENLKTAKLVVHRGATVAGDFIYELTDAGREKGQDARKMTTYVGPAPIPFEQYLKSVKAQSLTSRNPGPEDLHRAFADLSTNEELLERLGPAVTSCKALFLHGEPGNGKTSLAERITRCFGDSIWIPQTLIIDGHLIKLYDPATHEAVDPNIKPTGPQDRLDRRWIKIRRPTVITGGELTLEMLEIQPDYVTNIAEPPLQMKANCGTLVIDDFGRQRVTPQLILNRWIFPLEKRIDFQRLPDGRKITVPFDILLVFSSNLQPRDLADEAFLRRIPYKLHVSDPTEDEFRGLVETVAAKLKVQLPKGSVNYLLDRHFKMTKRPFRFCHPRDLLIQVVNICAFERRVAVAGPAEWDRVVSNYFGTVG